MSLCACGFPILKEDVPLGTEYEVDFESAQSGTLRCGGCGAVIPITIVKASARGASHAGIMPADIFDAFQPQ